ncbi:MAG TPA: hypothetical protein PKK43_08245 [Spirochaetota bacterium]|nr:hypothetical protein [Spirochaetota bacterium]
MILCAELQMGGESHVKINGAFLAILSRLSDQCLVFAEESHYRALLRESSGERGDPGERGRCVVSHQKITVAHRSRNRLVKEILGVINVIRLRSAVRRLRPEFVFVFSASPIMKVLLSKIAARTGVKFIMVCHGELEGLSSPGPRRIHRQNWWTEKLLSSPGRFSYLLIPSSFVYENLMQYVSAGYRSRIICFEHPIIFGTARTDEPVPFGGASFVSAGVASIAKSSHLIFELAEKAKRVSSQTAFRFALIGRVEEAVAARSNGLVDFRMSGSLLSFEEFAEGVRSADYLLYFYQDELYRLVPSGALLDALLYEKPVIAFDNGIMRNFFRVYGAVGVLCADTDAMADTIAKLAGGRDAHAAFVRAIRGAKARFSIASQAECFARLLKDSCAISAGGNR